MKMKNKEKYAKEIVEIVCEGCALAVSKEKEHYAGMAEHPPDRKASADFRRPAYPNYTVEDALKKWRVDTKKGVDAGGEDRREQREE